MGYTLVQAKVVCVKFSKKKGASVCGPSEAAAAERSPLGRAQRSGRNGLGCLPQHEFFVFAKFFHVEITMLLEPVLMRLGGQGPD